MRTRFFYCLLMLLAPSVIMANGWDDGLYKQIEQSIKTPMISDATVNITKYGAKPTASAAHNQKAIQKAINACSKKGGRVIVPAGQVFQTGSIELKSHINLVIEEGATLEFVFLPELYPIVETSWEGLECFNISPCIYAYKATDIAITGKGTIDGGGSLETWWPWCGAASYGWKEGIISQKIEARPRLLRNGEDGIPMYNEKGQRSPERVFGPKDGLRPQLINFNKCERILLEDITLLRSPFWVIHPLHSTDITIRGVKMINDGPNGDGCDPECCNRVLIENCFFNTGDDCIAIKSGRNRDGRERDMPSQNIIIRNCEMKNGHGGVVIGSEISGGCKNVFAHDCVMDSPELERVIRIKTNSCRGGIIENIYARNIKVGVCKESVLKINLDYEHNEICCRGYYPIVRNVNIENITSEKSKYGVQIIGLDEGIFVYDINVKDCRFNGVAKGNFMTGKTRDIHFDNLFINGTPIKPEESLQSSTISRRMVTTRNNPVVIEVDPLASLTVGNGHFATTVDITGLQSYPFEYGAGVPLTAMSDWGWHKFKNTTNLTPYESEKSIDLGHGHPEVYAVEYKVPAGSKEKNRNVQATEYFRMNPHRINLGVIGLEIKDEKGEKLGLDHLTDIHQELRLYDGFIESSYKANEQPVKVITACIPDKDAIVYRINSQLLKDQQAIVTLRFPYPTGKHSDDASDWDKENLHDSHIILQGDQFAIIEHILDETRYKVLLRWQGKAMFSRTTTHGFTLSTSNDLLVFEVEYLPEMPAISYVSNQSVTTTNPPTLVFDQELKKIVRHWNRWWDEGAIIDFSDCTDPRAKELERRVVLSQYLTQVNCANSMPPQETGLTYNSWFGRPHLEMTWWHMIDFSLWNRPQVLEKVLEWYNNVAYPLAKKIAMRQGFKGIRWMKMTDPWAGEAPSNVGSFLIWQQPHYIYMAEEMFRAIPTKETIEKYASIVEETAEFMADFVSRDAQSGKFFIQGETAMQESMSKDISYNHPFELAYWQYGLNMAQQWRERQGKQRVKEWDDIINHLSPLPELDVIYTAGMPKGDISEKSRNDHPAVLGVCGLLPQAATSYSPEKMKATLEWVMNNWNWQTTWGWDYGMIAMAATRLGEPETAINALLIDAQKNTYLKQGHNFQTTDRLRLYLPGNGALLIAVAMMCAGWDGCTTQNPGFPKDGNWKVRWEGLKKMQ